VKAGGPITVTHPDATRYFMTVTEAANLVIAAGGIGQNGEALVLDMGEPARILDVARLVSASTPVPIDFTGLRPGEKLHEQLFGLGEVDIRPFHPLISHVVVPPLHPMKAYALNVSADPNSVARDLAYLASGLEAGTLEMQRDDESELTRPGPRPYYGPIESMAGSRREG
jgi:FlaA1/EpsC-like NDP-sugar epimerase